MTLDETIAPYVNLVPQKEPGDIYAYVGSLVWNNLEKLNAKVTKEELARFDDVFAELQRLQKVYEEAPPKSEVKALAFQAAQEYRNNNRDLREKLFPLYWLKVEDLKLRRKICKRPVMTAAYGSVPYGMGQQVWDDCRELSDYLGKMEKLWSSKMGRLLYDTCREELSGPGRLLTLFERIAERFNEKEEYLSWRSPITNMPVVQNYRKPISERTWLRYGEVKMNVVVESWDTTSLDKEAQKLGASPNIVHSLDAVHMITTIHAANFPVAAIHDSWGTTAGNMPELFKLVRQKFVELYKTDPLLNILKQMDCQDLLPQRGALDVSEVIASDFAFC